jgi:hypothetical protein
LADLDHQLVERGVVAGGEGSEGIGALKESLLQQPRNSLCQNREFFLVGVQGLRQPADQSLAGAVLSFDPAQVGEAFSASLR